MHLSHFLINRYDMLDKIIWVMSLKIKEVALSNSSLFSIIPRQGSGWDFKLGKGVSCRKTNKGKG